MEHTALEDDFIEVENQLIEAMRAVNEAVRRAYKTGLDVKADIVTMHGSSGPMPQVTFWTTNWQRRT